MSVDLLAEQIALLENELNHAQDALADAQKGAERYRWLRESSHDTQIGVYEWVERDGRQQRAYLAFDELDAAIDAAMEGK